MHGEEQEKSLDTKHIYRKYNVDVSPKQKVKKKKIYMLVQGSGRSKENCLVSLWCCNLYFTLRFQQTASP